MTYFAFQPLIAANQKLCRCQGQLAVQFNLDSGIIFDIIDKRLKALSIINFHITTAYFSLSENPEAVKAKMNACGSLDCLWIF